MKVRVLGCGTSSGVPRIGNDWGSCDPSNPRNRRSRAAILADIAGERLLVDCGPDLREQLLAARVGTVDRVLITHDHADHCHGLDDLRQLAQNKGAAVPVWGRPEVLARLANRFGYAFHGTRDYPPVLESRPIEGDWTLSDGAAVRFVDQPHGRIESLGLRLDEGGKGLSYAIDFHDLSEAMAALYEGSDVWIADCLRVRPHPSHAHLDRVLGWARDLRVGQLMLSHMDNSMDEAELARVLPDWAAPAWDGMKVEL
jgi:phosphoribosyl 1,2-cyclic phosphate phosphodiesterase